MRALTEPDILNLWDQAANQHPLDRALTILQAADPAMERASAARRTIGERDRQLLHVSESTFGPVMDVVTHCPKCAGEIEFQFQTDEIHAPKSAAARPVHELIHEDWRVRFRLPDSRDLAALLQTDETQDPEQRLMSRCLISAECDRANRDAADVPTSLWDDLSVEMSKLDPQAEIDFSLACPACGHQWKAWFDIADFLWRKVSVTAQLLLREVDALARTYHWSESQILALSPARRRAYLELIQT